jgi:pimeloyl-ACP methyl ester carboxylesterase
MLCPPIAVQDFTRQLTQALSLSDSVRTNVERRLARRFGVAPEALHVAKVAPNMRTPLLLVHDQDDREVPFACGEAIAESWPGATLIRTQGLGHRRILRDPKVIEQAVRFVAGA